MFPLENTTKKKKEEEGINNPLGSRDHFSTLPKQEKPPAGSAGIAGGFLFLPNEFHCILSRPQKKRKKYNEASYCVFVGCCKKRGQNFEKWSLGTQHLALPNLVRN
jgi:hypothetical protein